MSTKDDHDTSVRKLLFLIDLFIEKKNYEQAFRIFSIAKHSTDKNNLRESLITVSKFYQKGAEICILEKNKNEFFFYQMTVLILEITIGALEMPLSYSFEIHLIRLRKEKHDMNNPHFNDLINRHFINNDDMLSFLSIFFERIILKMLIPLEHKQFRTIHRIKTIEPVDLVKSGAIIQLPQHFKKINAELFCKNLTALFGKILTDYCQNKEVNWLDNFEFNFNH